MGLAAPSDDLVSCIRIQEAGIAFHDWPLARRGLGPISTLQSLYRLHRIIRTFQPDMVHSLTIKPVILNGILCQLHRIPTVALIPGLGIAFLSPYLAPIAKALYSLALRSPRTRVCFQNPNDLTFFLHRNIVSEEQAELIPGSGVNTHSFAYKPYQIEKEKRVVTLAARLLKEKGILEFIEAARQIRAKQLPVTFLLAGAPDPGNPSSLDMKVVRSLCEKAQVTYLGHVEDMPKLLRESDIFCLPTYYPEGIPMALMQAASMGKALIASDVPGCREVVIDGETGILIPPRDPQALIRAIEKLITDPSLCSDLTARCYARLEENFAEKIIHEKTLSLYNREFV